MSEFEREEALWDTENGMENRQELHTEVQVEEVTEETTDVFEIPDIPAIFLAPEPVREEGSSQEVHSDREAHVWNAKTAKQQIKEAKRKYKLEKKRLRKERRMRGPRWGTLALIALLCMLLGIALGAIATWFFLTRYC